MNAFRALLACTCLNLFPAAAHAQPPAPDTRQLITADLVQEMRASLETEIAWLTVGAQNNRLHDLTQAQIDELDTQWKAEREVADKPVIAATLSNPLSVYLARMQGRSLGLYAEIFVMDQNGLNVGQSSVTSDFWQGDEDKFQKTYNVSEDALFIDEPEWDEEAKIWRNQVSFTLVDASRKKIGAVTIELNLTELERRSLTAS
ncbi:hypothetical protein [Agrobacterium sp. MA01]|uniref:hypothetical protein n=1 Tax=Agrobacterium sp. MA01 TaxID=2664893 RepID=UPI001FEE9C09|nr:hypothetical protein [Agrobacterium sp. MA01]